MNKTAIRNYAVWARTALIEAVTQKAFEYEIKDGAEMNGSLESIGGRLLTSDEKEWRKKLIDEIKHKNFNQVMEEAAYTWFNRFIALRYMEVNGFIPTRVRVFTNEAGEFKPDILKEAMTVELEGLKREKVIDLIEKQNNEELFKYLIITQCNALNQGLPYMFEKISNWTELLFPANLLRSDSIIGRMVNEIPEEDWQDAVQIIGWMYQYYNTELKDDTFAKLKKNIKITKERIPAATQLFTPDWIVRYMVENSLGKLWIEGHPDENLKANWKYYLDEAEQEPAVEAELQKIRSEYANIKPEDIKIIDPCMGSGHILVYAFDVLMQIYIANGYSERDAAKSILENNLYGLDIDDRAGQLAYFAVMMKARKYSRRILNSGIAPNVFSIQDSSFMSDDFITFVANKDHELELDLIGIRNAFVDAKEYGSILSIPRFDFEKLYARIEELKTYFPQTIFEVEYRTVAIERLHQLVKQAEMMHQKYDVVVTNPPYMGGSGMGNKLSEFVKKNYPNSKSDLFAVFIEKGNTMLKPYGYNSMVTMQSWMFLSSFEEMRKNILRTKTITNLMHMENMVMGIAFGTAVTILKNINCKWYKGTYNHIKLSDIITGIPKEFPVKNNRFAQVNSSNFANIPGSPIAYWVSEKLLEDFSLGEILKNKGDTRQGMATSDNNRFLRLWHEVELNKIGLGCTDAEDAKVARKKWYPYNKGGEFRKWYGNIDYTVNYENDGFEVKQYATSLYKTPSRTIKSMSEYFKPCLSWSKVTSGSIAFRYYPEGFVFDVAGCCIFYKDRSTMLYDFGFVNSIIAKNILAVISPTLNYEAGHIASLPVIREKERFEEVISIVQNNIDLGKQDWESFETSWDFTTHPLIRCVSFSRAEMIEDAKHHIQDMNFIEEAFTNWSNECYLRFTTLKENEEELNRIFIDIYGLQDELTPEVDDKDVTVRKADLQREIKSLISYAIGVIFGRYSLDVEGLCYAGGEWDSSKYKTIIPDADNILPICDDDYFEDDLTGKFVKFVEVVYGKETLEENLRFIADALGGKGTAREVIRNYLLNGFYADHLKIYQKRPIYWQFSSGKKNGFKALVYMHRYQPDLLARMRTDYVHEQQERYRTQLTMLEESVDSAAPSEKVKINKQIAKLRDQSLEIQKFEEKVHHLADQMITIDLDDGVKVNYEKFAEVLEKIK